MKEWLQLSLKIWGLLKTVTVALWRHITLNNFQFQKNMLRILTILKDIIFTLVGKGYSYTQFMGELVQIIWQEI